MAEQPDKFFDSETTDQLRRLVESIDARLGFEIQTAISQFTDTQDSRVASLIGELRGFFAELNGSNPKTERLRQIRERAEQIFRDLGEMRET